jgi:hypothetical protein
MVKVDKRSMSKRIHRLVARLRIDFRVWQSRYTCNSGCSLNRVRRPSRRIVCGMKLKHANPYLKSAADLRAALRISAQSSSAVEGIFAPFSEEKDTRSSPATTIEFKSRWKRLVALSNR